jgi:hypothetical protein
MNLHLLQKRVVSYKSPFDPDYQAVLDRAVFLGYTLPSTDQQKKQNQVLVDLKTAGIWNKLDIFYLMANNGSKGFAQINWKSPENFQLTDVNFTSTFIVNQGLQGSITSTHFVETGWAPLIGVNFTLNDASLYAYLFNPASNTTVPFSSGNQTQTIRMVNEVIKRINTGFGNLTVAFNHTNVKGMKSINRVSSTQVWLSNDKIGDFRDSNSTNVGTASLTQKLFVYNTINSSNNCILSTYSAGASLVSENDDYVDIIQDYLDSL